MSFLSGFAAMSLIGCALGPASPDKTVGQAQPAKVHDLKLPMNTQSIIVAGGCFWCVEAIYEDLKGVLAVESAYVGGAKPGVTYDEVCSGRTGHAEAIKVSFDPSVVSADDLLKVFFTVHNPTTLNRQGGDSGTQYRSAIFYNTPEEKAQAERVITEVQKEKIWPDPIVTTVEPVKNYTRAEEYHQDYFAKFEKATPAERMTMNAGYCSAIIQPKVRKFRDKYAAKLKKTSVSSGANGG